MRLGTRLFLLVVLSSLLPALLVLVAGWLQVRKQVRLWTIPSVESALEASLQTNRRAFDRLQRHLEAEGRVLAESRLFPAETDTAALGELLDAGVRQFGIDLAQFYAWTGEGFRLVASGNSSGAGGPDLAPRLTPPGGAMSGPQAPEALRASDGDEDLVAVSTFVWSTVTEEPRLRGALLLAIRLGPRYYDRLTEVSSGLVFYRRLEEVGRVLRTGYALLALAVLLVSLGASLWIARRVARSVSRPVDDLIRGMGALGREETARKREDALAAVARSSIPEMARLASAFAEMRATLRAYEERLREAERVRGAQETARFVAHEIRNALTPVRAALSVLERRLKAAEVPAGSSGEADPGNRSDRAIGLIRREADRMSALAGAFSEYGRFPETNPEPLELGALLEPLARAEVPPRIALVFRRPARLPLVSVDRDEFERLSRNLVKNAVEAITEEGTITVTLSSAASRVVVEIEDTGCGMDEEALRKVFQPGFTTKPAGSGLGLSLVRRAVAGYGGTVAVWSHPGEGTRIRIDLPALTGTAEDGAKDAPRAR